MHLLKVTPIGFGNTSSLASQEYVRRPTTSIAVVREVAQKAPLIRGVACFLSKFALGGSQRILSILYISGGQINRHSPRPMLVTVFYDNFIVRR